MRGHCGTAALRHCGTAALLLTVLFLVAAGCPVSEQIRSEPQVTIRASQAPVTEGDELSFTVTAMPAPGADLVVSVTVTETGDTLAASVPQKVTIAAGKTTAKLQVQTVGDETDESRQHGDRNGERRHRLHGRLLQIGRRDRGRR